MVELLFDCNIGLALFDDVAATSPVVLVWLRRGRCKNLLSFPFPLPLREAASFDGDPTAWAGVVEDDKVSGELLDASPGTICFRLKNSMVARVVVVSSQVSTRGKSALCDTQLIYTAAKFPTSSSYKSYQGSSLKPPSSAYPSPQPPEPPQSSQ